MLTLPVKTHTLFSKSAGSAVASSALMASAPCLMFSWRKMSRLLRRSSSENAASRSIGRVGSAGASWGTVLAGVEPPSAAVARPGSSSAAIQQDGDGELRAENARALRS